MSRAATWKGAHYASQRRAVIVGRVAPDGYWGVTVWKRDCASVGGMHYEKRLSRDFYGDDGRARAMAYARRFTRGKGLRPGYVVPVTIARGWCR